MRIVTLLNEGIHMIINLWMIITIQNNKYFMQIRYGVLLIVFMNCYCKSDKNNAKDASKEYCSYFENNISNYGFALTQKKCDSLIQIHLIRFK
jgi:hypothetical protein